MQNRHMSRKIDIISIYLNNLKEKYTGREIARRTNINHQTALNHLKILEKERILNIETKGKNKEYFLNLDNISTKIILELAELNKSYNFLNKNEKIKIIIEDLIKNYKTIIIFGSYAKNTFNNLSDLDIIILDKKNNKIESIKERYPLNLHIEFSSINKLEKNEKNNLVKEIIKSHLVFGDISEFTTFIWRFYNNEI